MGQSLVDEILKKGWLHPTVNPGGMEFPDFVKQEFEGRWEDLTNARIKSSYKRILEGASFSEFVIKRRERHSEVRRERETASSALQKLAPNNSRHL